MTSSPERRAIDDAAAGAVVDVAAVQARLPARAGADARRRSCCRCSPRCPTRCSRCGSSCSATACSGTGRAWCCVAAIGLGVSAAATWFLRTVSTRVQRRFRDKVTIALESHVARLQASVATIAHHERPEYLDRLVDAARPGLRARPHVHVGVLDLRLDPAPRRHDRAAGVDPPGARRCWPCSRCRRC